MQVLVLQNHGILIMGNSIEEAFSIAHSTAKACEIQVATYQNHIHEKICDLICDQVATMSAAVGVSNMSQVQLELKSTKGSKVDSRWKPGELEFEALMRMLDNKVVLRVS